MYCTKAQNRFIPHLPRKRKAEPVQEILLYRPCASCIKNEAAKGRTICETCKCRIWIEKNPERYAWHMLKKSAKKRNLPFTLTFEHFKTMCANSGYIAKAGRLFNSLTVERINPDYGYHDNNVMVVPKRFNSAKHNDTFINEDLPF